MAGERHAGGGNERASTPRASLVAALGLLGDSALYPALPAKAAELGLSTVEVGVLLAANRFVRLALNRPVGSLFDRLGPRGPLVLAAVVAVATTALTAVFASSFLPFLVVRCAWGFAWSALRLGGFVAVLDGPAERRGALMGTFSAIARLGSLAGVLLGGLLVDRFGFHAAFFVLATLQVPGLFVARAAFPAGKRLAPPPPPPGTTVAKAPDRRLEWALLAATLLLGLVGPGFLTTCVGSRVAELARAERAVGASESLVATLAGLPLVARYGASIVLSAIAGALADRIGRRAVAVTGGLLSAALVALAARAGSLAGFVLAAGGAFLALSVFQAALDALAQDVAARAAGAVPSLQRYADALDVGAALGSLALGLADPRLGLDLPVLLAASAALLALATGVAAVLAASLNRGGGGIE